MLISITGMLASGKSTVCSIISEKHNFERICTGVIMREVARDMGITVGKLNQLLMDDPSLDNKIDAMVTRMSIEKANEDIIFDSRMAWHFAKDTFKVFLTIDSHEAAERVMKNQRGVEERYENVQEAEEMLLQRSRDERQRFIAIYGQDYYDKNNYDFIVDTTHRTPEEVVSLIIENLHTYFADPKAFGSPKIV